MRISTLHRITATSNHNIAVFLSSNIKCDLLMRYGLASRMWQFLDVERMRWVINNSDREEALWVISRVKETSDEYGTDGLSGIIV